MEALEIIVICEAVAAITIMMIVIAIAAAIQKSKKGKDRLYDPYGLYSPVTAGELVGIDAAAATVAEAARLQQSAQYAQNARKPQ